MGHCCKVSFWLLNKAQRDLFLGQHGRGPSSCHFAADHKDGTGVFYPLSARNPEEHPSHTVCSESCILQEKLALGRVSLGRAKVLKLSAMCDSNLCLSQTGGSGHLWGWDCISSILSTASATFPGFSSDSCV